MESRSQAWFFLSFLFILSTIINLSSAADAISSGQSLTGKQTLTSKGGKFELGFFRPGNSPNFYIGIWYKKISVQSKIIVWVANRDTPINTSSTSSELKLLEDGNLVLLNSSKNLIWSTKTTSNTLNSSEAVLRDDGNLVLGNGVDVYWQSFDYPTDTLLPGGRIGYDKITKKSQILTSWKSPEDPSKGMFSLKLDAVTDQYLINWNYTQRYWSSGSWDGQIFSRVPEMRSNSIYNYSYIENVNESYFIYNIYNTSNVSRFVMDLSGQINILIWDETTELWFPFWNQPRQQCEVYAYCGAFGVCNQNGFPICRCMDGFEPRSPMEWNILDYSSGGCVRKTPLQCGGKDALSLMPNVRLPANHQLLAGASADECKSSCLNNCNCSAYVYKSDCLIWNGDLLNLQQFSQGDDGGEDLYLRLAPGGSRNKGAKIGVILGAVAAALGLVSIVSYYIGLKKKSKWNGNIIINNKSITSPKESGKDLELPIFNLVTIAASTNNFTLSNKIGQGGFGPVYKGLLPSGEEIAIKRLSKVSRQGIQEFMNEVVLIAKLQHRNLVRLLGCCIQGEERILVYEYMPNKSLDFFIFDSTRSVNLDWNKRFNIIVGIARGLLYLHRDSRLRIIHRDLKAGNVLLDNKMNPKISDFGIARTFRAKQTEENTRRVVGTYGYMSPEYAIDGLFSMKSDVFSFGVIILEIVCGQKNRGFHHAGHDLNLLGHAWKLLNDSKALELMDASIKSSFTISEVLKCIQVGLLCVQKFPEDRPEMPYVLSMLESDGAMLPWPKEPGFYTERSPFEKVSTLAEAKDFTKNEVTVTLLEGR